MTLTEFLLARIAEDEHRAKYDTPHWEDCEHFRYFNEGGLPCTCGLEGRLLAECEAKRRIVNARRAGFPDEDRYAVGWHDMHAQALTWLALPYADHPDFDPDWSLA